MDASHSDSFVYPQFNLTHYNSYLHIKKNILKVVIKTKITEEITISFFYYYFLLLLCYFAILCNYLLNILAISELK